ncbi:MAG: DUF2332 family protein [Actinobacteria bacterium]|uniref:Unannotated protein n=1 Tax=freshwater metagenome TaxID=449393 RepID=A0A6J6SHH0_9ZZZZ|nr:DUF2332 family protein [Actinomycetota bacterium]
MELWGPVASAYRDFAAYADGDSPCFAAWARAVAEDEQVGAWLLTLPEPRRQPNLIFAAARWHGVEAPGPYSGLRDALLGDDGRLRATVLSRTTQTNEVGRIATLLPALAMAAGEEPVSLLEVGASAGLCLYPDRWDVRWLRGSTEVRTAGAGPWLTCDVIGDPPLPARSPRVAWRGGIDLNPLDVTDDDAMAWLTTLVWPEHDDRRALLAQAIEIARRDPAALVRGDLLTELPGLVERASAHGRVVVFHSAVIAYLDEVDRRRFHELMSGLVAAGACRWVSNEGKRVLPEVTATGPEVPEERATFVLGLDGRALGWTHGHGRSLEWLPQPRDEAS